MNDIDVLRRTNGVWCSDGATHVRLWAPKTKQAAIKILGPGAGTTIALEESGKGYWQATFPGCDSIQYMFAIDGGKELPDPASLYQPQGVHGPSETFDTAAFNWSDSGWVNPAIEHYIFYELHAGTFSAEGTFAGIEEKLDYLVACGITAVEIMPVAQFPGTRNWGYDGVYPFAVQQSYGGPRMLQQLVDKCHEKGLAVVLDVVYNHFGPEGNHLAEYGYYFTDRYKTPWGDAINFDDAHSDEVRRYFIENALMWFRDFHIDALRLDAVHAIKDFSPVHILSEIKTYTDELMAKTGRTHYLVVECDLNDPRYIDEPDARGYGMNAQWTDEFHHALRVAAGNEQQGYYADFNGLEHLAKAYKDAYVYDGIYSPQRLKTFGSKAQNNDGRQFIVFSQNHDQVGNRMLGERTSHLLSFEMQKLLAAAVLVSPFLPLLFMGEEWAAPHPFQYFISHTDEELVAAVRKGRKEEFASFHSDADAPDPQAENTFSGCRLQWQLLQQEPHSIMYSYYRELIALRKAMPALYNLNREHVEATILPGTQVLMLHRWHQQQHVICFMNFSNHAQPITMPPEHSSYDRIFDSAAAKWRSPGSEHPAKANENEIILQPESVMIYNNQNV